MNLATIWASNPPVEKGQGKFKKKIRKELSFQWLALRENSIITSHI